MPFSHKIGCHGNVSWDVRKRGPDRSSALKTLSLGVKIAKISPVDHEIIVLREIIKNWEKKKEITEGKTYSPVGNLAKRAKKWTFNRVQWRYCSDAVDVEVDCRDDEDAKETKKKSAAKAKRDDDVTQKFIRGVRPGMRRRLYDMTHGLGLQLFYSSWLWWISERLRSHYACGVNFLPVPPGCLGISIAPSVGSGVPRQPKVDLDFLNFCWCCWHLSDFFSPLKPGYIFYLL